MFSEVVMLYLKRFCSIKNTISYYWWEFSTCRFSKASFLLVTKQPSTGQRSIARPGLDDGPALLSSDVQAGGTNAIAAGSSSRIVELGSSICSCSVFHWFHCPYPKRKYRARVPTILMPPTFPIASLDRQYSTKLLFWALFLVLKKVLIMLSTFLSTFLRTFLRFFLRLLLW